MKQIAIDGWRVLIRDDLDNQAFNHVCIVDELGRERCRTTGLENTAVALARALSKNEFNSSEIMDKALRYSAARFECEGY